MKQFGNGLETPGSNALFLVLEQNRISHFIIFLASLEVVSPQWTQAAAKQPRQNVQ